MDTLPARLARSALIALALSAATSSAQDVQPTPLPDTHPFVGKWRFDLPQLGCFEEYDVRANGTLFVVAGEERSESAFTISPEPSDKGYYKWIDRIVRNNGKADCIGSTTPTGHVATIYLLFHRDGDRFLLCEQEDIKTCIGPYVRMKGKPV